MELTFLGTGGCRFNMVKQIRQTGGFILKEGEFMLSVDPGPGAVVYANKNNFDLEKLTAVFVSHCHLDHEGDVEVMIEGMTSGCLEDKGVIISNSDYLDSSLSHSSLSDYHRDAVNEKVWTKDEESFEFENGFEMVFKDVVHGNVDTTGFVLDYGSGKVGWIPDTSMFEGLAEKFSDVDYLVVSCARPHDMDWSKHLDLGDAVRIIDEVDPEKSFITHLGVNFENKLEDEKKWLEKNSKGQDIVIAEDNQVFEI